MTIYLITQHETEDSIGFGCSFKSEAFTEKEKAERRYITLQNARTEYSGIYYTIESIELDTESDDY